MKNLKENEITESVDQVFDDFISFINRQVGVYMDALSGFAGHYTRINIKILQILRRRHLKQDDHGTSVNVMCSYEDPSGERTLHNRIIKSDDYIAENAPGGSNEQQIARAILIFLFTYWEDEIRPRIANTLNKQTNEIKSDVMGDLRYLRNSILHTKGVLRPENYKKLTVTKCFFNENETIHITYDTMHQIFVLAKQDCARLMYDWLGELNPIQEVAPENIEEIGISKSAGGKSMFILNKEKHVFERKIDK